MKRADIVFAIILFALLSCTETRKHNIDLSFYYWKLDGASSTFTPTKYPNSHIYLHIADIYWDEQLGTALPKAKSRIKKEDSLFAQSITPVVFLDQKIFSKTPSDSLDSLANRLLKLYHDFYTFFNLDKHSVTPSLQIDCDWLASNKEKYFAFLKLIKEKRPDLVLSATIRMYPYKYKQTMGVPPVDYGVLMCYNLERISDVNTENSILTPKTLSEYLTKTSYPIPLKPALPIFGWYAWIREDQYINLIYQSYHFVNSPYFVAESERLFRVVQDTVVSGHYLRKGDLLRREYPTIKDLNKSLDLLVKHIRPKEIILYHWDENLVNHYEEFITNNR